MQPVSRRLCYRRKGVSKYEKKDVTCTPQDKLRVTKSSEDREGAVGKVAAGMLLDTFELVEGQLFQLIPY